MTKLKQLLFHLRLNNNYIKNDKMMIYFCTKFVHIHITQNKSIMKNTVLMSVMFLLTFLFSCTSQTYVDEKSLDQFINSNELTFMAKRANPTNFDVINVMNSMPNNNSARMLNLDYGYSVVLKDKELTVNLPYFGRLFNPSYDTSKNSYNFTSKDFTISKVQNKKGNWVYTISPKDQNNIKVIYLEIFKNGAAFVSIDSSDRQAISYDGYIMKNETNK